MRIGMLQLNPVVGDITGNTDRMIEAISSLDADLIVTPELSICGYPPRDLLHVSGFVHACEQSVHRIAQASQDAVVIVGHPRIDAATGRVRNSVSALHHGEVIATGDKQLLPSYDVFDEKRYFEPGEAPCMVEVDGIKIGIAVCEDFWRGFDAEAAPTYDINPVSELIDGGCTIIVSPSASPFVTQKRERHLQYTLELAAEHDVTVVMCNQVGGNDDLVFDGGSYIATPNGLLGELPLFETGAIAFDLSSSAVSTAPQPTEDEERFNALKLGVHDYFNKTNHTQALVGLSGGIDSALTATIAVAALGADAVTGVLMPSRFSSLGSVEDAEQLSTNLGIATSTLPIEHMHTAFERIIEEARLTTDGLANENAQARLRGLLLMALANQQGSLLLATGNKSELAVGYSTLYGDMAGALSVIGDIYKTDVWSMSTWINENAAACGFAMPPIPDASITKAPSAELRPDQLDQDSLPPYDVLDSILRLHIDLDLGTDEIEESLDCEETLIAEIVKKVDQSQFKRDQAAVILKTSPRSFGRGRRMPIVMHRNWITTRETT
jgi:NAD+ synthase (glutamine-hydrolysing)